MDETLDVAVVGAGPAGSYAALHLARLGFKVCVFEEHTAIGVPTHCAGHLSIASLKSLGLYPLPNGIVENIFSCACFHSPSGFEVQVHLNKPVTCAVNRAAFDVYLAGLAENSGAVFSMNSRVDGFLFEKGSVAGVLVKQNGVIKRVKSRIVIDAEGIAARLLRQAGVSLKRRCLIKTVQADIADASSVGSGAVHVFLGKAYAPGFYAWLIPRKDGTAKLGVGVRYGHPYLYLQNLAHKHPVALKLLYGARVIRTVYHTITLDGPLTRVYGEGFLAVGDAASQVKPTTGGGVVPALICAKLAAEVVVHALEKNDASRKLLQSYGKKIQKIFGFDMRVMRLLRRFLDELSDDQIDRIIRSSCRANLPDLFSDVEEVDFQGRTLLKLLGSSAALVALTRFSAAYCFANS